jgi:nitroimidazol reductase NimA-like FMN-containing flavoprotein (pyridoxamine 5'-phosphate oxidase superfamily)
MSESASLRRQDKAIVAASELWRILDEAAVLHLGMVDEGRPYVIPVNFAREDDLVWIHCATAGRVIECLRRQPSVCVEVDRFLGIVEGPQDDACAWTARYESVIGFGAAEIVARQEDRVHGMQMIMKKYSGHDGWTFAEEKLAKVAVLRVRLESLTGKHSPV